MFFNLCEVSYTKKKTRSRVGSDNRKGRFIRDGPKLIIHVTPNYLILILFLIRYTKFPVHLIQFLIWRNFGSVFEISGI